MSWNFAHSGRDKEALKRATIASFDASARYYTDYSKAGLLLAPVKSIVLAAIDVAAIPKSAYCLKVETSGHVDDEQCYFGVTVTPVYLPQLVDKTT